jgi:hypothetical protein
VNRTRALGDDPAPGSLAAVERLLGTLRESVIALSRARRGVEHLLASQAWCQGAVTEAARTELGTYAQQLGRVEDAVVEHAAALTHWRTVLARHAERANELAERATALPDTPETEGQRRNLGREVALLAADHDREAAALERGGDELVAALAPADSRVDDDLVSALGRSLNALEVAVQEWVRDAREELRATDALLDRDTAVATTVTALWGAGAAVPGLEDPRVAALVAGSPAAHRIEALLSAPLAPESAPLLAPAGFATGAGLAGRLRHPGPAARAGDES